MKPIPHPHSCPSCTCSWPCMNQLCGDLEMKYCCNLCEECKIPPPYLQRLTELQEAHEELLHAAYTLEHGAQEPDLADLVRGLLPLLRTRAQERNKGLPRTNEERDLQADAADLHAGEF